MIQHNTGVQVFILRSYILSRPHTPNPCTYFSPTWLCSQGDYFQISKKEDMTVFSQVRSGHCHSPALCKQILWFTPTRLYTLRFSWSNWLCVQEYDKRRMGMWLIRTSHILRYICRFPFHVEISSMAMWKEWMYSLINFSFEICKIWHCDLADLQKLGGQINVWRQVTLDGGQAAHKPDNRARS